MENILDISDRKQLNTCYMLMIVIVVLSPRRFFSISTFDFSYGYIVILSLPILYFKYLRFSVSQSFVFFFFIFFLAIQLYTSSAGLFETLKTNMQFVLLYTVLIFEISVTRKFYTSLLEFFQKLLVFACAYGVLQLLFRILFGMPDILSALSIHYIRGYDYLNPTRFIPLIEYKVNSFYSEPSIFSQFLAAGIILEISFFRNAKRLMVYSISMILTFSGTGLLILGIYFAISLAFSKSRFKFIVAILVIICIFSSALVFSKEVRVYYITRLLEIQDPFSSAHIRFVAPLVMVYHVLMKNFMLGLGGGAHDLVAMILGIPFNYRYDSNSYAFLFICYGVVGLTLFLMLISRWNVRKDTIEKVILSTYLVFLITGMYILNYVPIFYIFLFTFKICNKEEKNSQVNETAVRETGILQ